MKNFLRNIIRLYFMIAYRIQVEGEEHLPKGHVVLAPNHNHAMDPLLMGIVYRPDVCAIAKAELFKNAFVRKILLILDSISVDREGNDLAAIRAAMDRLKTMSLIIFAEGTRNRGEEPLEAKAGMPLIAAKAKVPIIPVTIIANYKFRSLIKVIYHPAVRVEDYGFERLDSAAYQKIAQDVMNKVYDRRRQG